MFRRTCRRLLNRDPYEVLDLSNGASVTEVKKAYHHLVLKYHPDTVGGGNSQKFKELTDAYELLKNGKYQSTNPFEAGAHFNGNSSTDGMTHDVPGSTSEPYVAGRNQAYIRIVLYWCVCFILLRSMLLFIFPHDHFRGGKQLPLPIDQGDEENRNRKKVEDRNSDGDRLPFQPNATFLSDQDRELAVDRDESLTPLDKSLYKNNSYFQEFVNAEKGMS